LLPHYLSDSVIEINGLAIKKQTGFDEKLNSATWSQGRLLVDTLFRFKGQCADAVVLTEIDFVGWDQVTKNKLFVGLTRARLTINLVMSEAVEEAFIERGFN
jgi:hypothetical protein